MPRLLALALVAAGAATLLASPLYSGVQVSDVGTYNQIYYQSAVRSVAVGPTGEIYVAFASDNSLRVAKSTNRGQSFLPSVQVSEDDVPADIAVDENGVVHVTWGAYGIYYSRSTDGGATFSTPTVILDPKFNKSIKLWAAHLALDPPWVYIVPEDGIALFRNGSNGVGDFSQISTEQNSYGADVHVDPANGDVIVATSDDNVVYYVGTDHGATLGTQYTLTQRVARPVMLLARTAAHRYLYAAGATNLAKSDTVYAEALRIDLDTGAVTELDFGDTISSSGRALAVDAYDNVVDGYPGDSVVKYAVSADKGATFAPAVTVATAEILSLAINSYYGDIVAVYQNAGQIYCSVYTRELRQGPRVVTAEPSAIQATTATAGGEVEYDGNDTITARGVCWSTTSGPTIADSHTSDGTGTGTFTSALTGLSASTTYYVRAYATNAVTTSYGDELTFTTSAALPQLQISVQPSGGGTGGTTQVTVGQEVPFVITVQNVGNGGASGVVITIPIPPVMQYVLVTVLDEPVARTAPQEVVLEGSNLRVTVGNVSAGAQVLLELILLATQTGTVSLEASTSSAEQPAPVTATTTAQVAVSDDYYTVITRQPLIPLCGGLGLVPLALVVAGLGDMKRWVRRGGR